MNFNLILKQINRSLFQRKLRKVLKLELNLNSFSVIVISIDANLL
jgi:hypothetical protein